MYFYVSICLFLFIYSHIYLKDRYLCSSIGNVKEQGIKPFVDNNFQILFTIGQALCQALDINHLIETSSTIYKVDIIITILQIRKQVHSN